MVGQIAGIYPLTPVNFKKLGGIRYHSSERWGRGRGV